MVHRSGPRLSGLFALAAALLLAGCAQNPPAGEVYDPIEPWNRKVFWFNQQVDTYVLKPASDAYIYVTPEPARKGVTNFFTNSLYPSTILNNFLQGKVAAGLTDVMRFMVNTTLGVGGLFDPATAMRLPAHNEDFGQTLAVWGLGPGPYLELPVLGPSNGRDIFRLPVDWFMNVYPGVINNVPAEAGLTATNVVNTRASLDKAIEIRRESALDPYVFTRSAYDQRRTNMIYDGNPPEQDLFDDAFFEDMDGEPAAEPPAPDGGAAPAED